MWKISFSKVIHKAVMNLFVHQIANGWICFAIWMYIELEGRAQKWVMWTCSSLYSSVGGIKQHTKKELLVNFPNWVFSIIGIKINGRNFWYCQWRPCVLANSELVETKSTEKKQGHNFSILCAAVTQCFMYFSYQRTHRNWLHLYSPSI